jgi:hypothetical protein
LNRSSLRELLVHRLWVGGEGEGKARPLTREAFDHDASRVHVDDRFHDRKAEA